MLDLKHLTFIFLLLSLIFAQRQYIPTPRYSHTAVMIGNKIYFTGGYNHQGKRRFEDFFYLDLSIPIDTTQKQKIPFFSENNEGLTANSWSISGLGGKNKDQIFIFGGFMDDNSSLVLQYDSPNKRWIRPIINGSPLPIRRRETTSVVDDEGLMYIWSGTTNTFFGQPFNDIIDDMVILDTVGLSWQIKSTPFARYSSTAVLLSDGMILYIGGRSEDFGYVPMNQLTIYNTKLDTWFNITTSGFIPEGRVGHTAILGNLTNYGETDELLILDIANKAEYKWVTTIDKPVPISISPSNNSTPNPKPGGVNVGLLIGIGLVSLGLISGGIFYFWYRNKRRNNQYGGNNNNIQNHDRVLEIPKHHINDQIQEYHLTTYNDFQTPALTISSQEYKTATGPANWL
ncbi:14358_t:CDS:2 [Funneliformis caledonium]|uniref:14358_t:CDS:1 n=1 Tax=Funneliformis caledonium TaxID=1117310 RepID=A0A9N8VB44_9GLOM|nr:14358_t:CDS:2 [Funneliformis caledonium]